MKPKVLLVALFILETAIVQSENADTDGKIIQDTIKHGTVTDIDGNLYTWLKIGDQRWMTQNLRVTRYSDGTEIPQIIEDVDWDTITEIGKAYCFYDTVGTSYTQYTREKYGALYSWAAAVNGQINNDTLVHVQGVCPDGWHVPGDKDWTKLERYLAEYGYAYDSTVYNRSDSDKEIRKKIAKSLAADWGWFSHNIIGAVGDSTYASMQNLSGFSAIPAGYRHYHGIYAHLGDIAIWWTSTQYFTSMAWFRFLGYKYPYVSRRSYDKDYGLPVRCVQD